MIFCKGVKQSRAYCAACLLSQRADGFSRAMRSLGIFSDTSSGLLGKEGNSTTAESRIKMSALKSFYFPARAAIFLRLTLMRYSLSFFCLTLSLFFAPSTLSFGRTNFKSHDPVEAQGQKRYSDIPRARDGTMSRWEKSSQESRRILLPLYDVRRTPKRRRSAETAAVNLRLVIGRR